MRRFFIVAAFLILGGCVGPARDAGLTRVEVTYSDTGKLSGITYVDGKEKKDVTLKFEGGGIKAGYSATEVRAFDGQKVAADLQKQLAAQGVTATVAAVKAALAASTLGGLMKAGTAVAPAVLGPPTPLFPPTQ